MLDDPMFGWAFIAGMFGVLFLRLLYLTNIHLIPVLWVAIIWHHLKALGRLTVPFAVGPVVGVSPKEAKKMIGEYERVTGRGRL